MSKDERAALGRTRLSIIDLATGDQPISNEDGTIHIVVNGEFYDFERTRGELMARRHRFRTKSDSEIALHRREAAVLRRAQRSALSRVGSQGAVRDGRAGAMEQRVRVRRGFVLPGERTLFGDVHAVPPGHYLRATRESHRVHQYWDVDYPRDDSAPAPKSDAEYIEGFRAVLEEAVKTRLRADVPVGCYLSGGIDSCAVLGLASRHHDGPVRAYTLRRQRVSCVS